MTASPISASSTLQATTVAASAGPALADPLGVATRRRRRATAQVRSITDAGAGAASLAQPTQQLPFSARASFSGGSLLLPIVGAVVGTLLLGIPGTIIGGVVGWLISRR